jgi:hypothetical protein
MPQRHQSLFGVAFGDSPIIEISVRTFKIRLISEVIIVSEHTIIQIKKFFVFKYWFEKESAANRASPRY